MFSRWLPVLALPALAITAMLALPDTAQAQRVRIGGGRTGVYMGSDPGYYYGGRGGAYYDSSYGPRYSSGWGSRYDGYGYGYGSYSPGWRSMYDGYGYGYGSYSYPRYTSRFDSYSPRYYSGIGYGSSYYSPGAIYSDRSYVTYSPPAGAGTLVDYRSFYQPEPTVNVHFTLRVPPDAEIWFADSKTVQKGAERQYVSPPLTPGKNYSYEITAKWMKDGNEVTDKRTVQFQAGSRPVSVDFTTPQTP